MTTFDAPAGASAQAPRLLSGLGVLVTRPAAQAEGLVREIEHRGGRALRFPTLEIAPARDLAAAKRRVEALDRFDIAVFVSANAVDYGLALVRTDAAGGLRPRIAALGAATARRLRDQGCQVHIQPQDAYNSEALLALPALAADAVRASTIVIFKGEGGLELLADELRARAAEVVVAEVYRRLKPEPHASPPLEAFERQVDIVVSTSGDAMKNLFELAGRGGRRWLCKRPFVVPSVRLARIASELGVEQTPVVAAKASDRALVDAMARLGAQGQSRR